MKLLAKSRWPLVAAFALAFPAASLLKASIRQAQGPLSSFSTRARLPYADDGPPAMGTFPVQWINGTDCATERQIQVHAYNRNLYILRQGKCSNFEAPFLYLIFGSQKALLIDTGSAGNPPVQQTVDQIVQVWLAQPGTPASIELIVAHSHGHFDHVQGDAQFQGQPDTTVVPPTSAGMRQFFGFDDWPNQIVSYDLGGRVLDVLPTPGHHSQGITFYDRRTDILFTGDTVYPGHLFTFAIGPLGWGAFKDSLRLLDAWTQAFPVAHVLGCHIEMTAVPGVPFSYGETMHPNEHELRLDPGIFADILAAAEAMGSNPTCEVHAEYVIHPVFQCGFGFP